MPPLPSTAVPVPAAWLLLLQWPPAAWLRQRPQAVPAMNATWGTVAARDGDHAVIRLDDDGGCGRCHETGGCGGTHITRLLCRTPRTFRVRDPEHRAVGARVRIIPGAGSVRRSVLYAYAIPLLALLLAALAGSGVAGEAGAIAGAMAGLLVGWLGLRRAQRRAAADPRSQPSIES